MAVATVGLGGADVPDRRTAFKIIGFIKPFQKKAYAEIASIAAEVGWSGIECPLRKRGTIEPERVEEELPELVEALGRRSLEVSVISTDVEDANDALTQKVLRAASKLGIRQYRMKHYYYDLNKPIGPQLEIFRGKLRELADLNRQLNIQGSVQNHSGRNYVGAGVWDIRELIGNLDPKHMGVFFDIGHATIEGGMSWPIEAKLVEPHLATVSVKDFFWAKGEGGWRAEWCPLGDGMVSRQYFQTLGRSGFSGPITQQFEYRMGEGAEMVAAMKKDLGVLRRWLGAS